MPLEGQPPQISRKWLQTWQIKSTRLTKQVRFFPVTSNFVPADLPRLWCALVLCCTCSITACAADDAEVTRTLETDAVRLLHQLRHLRLRSRPPPRRLRQSFSPLHQRNRQQPQHLMNQRQLFPSQPQRCHPRLSLSVREVSPSESQNLLTKGGRYMTHAAT